MEVGFYYMANAEGWLIGTLLPGQLSGGWVAPVHRHGRGDCGPNLAFAALTDLDSPRDVGKSDAKLPRPSTLPSSRIILQDHAAVMFPPYADRQTLSKGLTLMKSDMPIIGAALAIDEIATFRDWIFEKQRDLKLETFHDPAVISGDWQPHADAARRLLDGYTGRLGIHGPFWGFTIHSKAPDVRAIVARRMDQGLDICAAVGATQMVIHSPYSTWNYNNPHNCPTGRDTLIENTHDTLRAAVKRGEDQGVVLVVENIEDIDPADRKRLVQSFVSPASAFRLTPGMPNMRAEAQVRPRSITL